MNEKQKKLISLLKEMFQFDQADLDFGIYRIMNMKRDEIETYLLNKLPEQISDGIASLRSLETKAKAKEIQTQIDNIKAGSLPQDFKDQAVGDLTKQLEALKGVDVEDLEADVYSRLLDFFSRYYDEGDFISQRRYKDGAYAIPYEGEEVKLYWANADQYYVKTAEYFNDYSFVTKFGKKVLFKIVEAETEKDNNKANVKRFFVLHEEKHYEIVDGNLTIFVEYREVDVKKQEEASKIVFDTLRAEIKDHEFASLFVAPNSKEKSSFEIHWFRYTAKNTYDYFIHKDLGKFLRRELDFYIKNEVLLLDDIQVNDMKKTKAQLVKAQVIRGVATNIIAFLAQIEGFQKKMYLKKKMVVSTDYCVSLDRIPEEFYPEIAANDAQREEWIRLFSIDEIQPETGTLVDAARIGYSNPLTVQFLKENPFLLVDTKFFGQVFKERVVATFESLDEETDGLLIRGDNFQALRLIKNRFLGQVDSIHIDPPYNTDTSGFLYKNNYRHSSFASMMRDRIDASLSLLNDRTGTFMCHIDENEYELLFKIFDEFNLPSNGTIVWDKLNPMLGRKGVATQHEYIIFRSNLDDSIYSTNANADKIRDYAKKAVSECGGVNDESRKLFKQLVNKDPGFSGGDKAYHLLDDDGKVFRLVAMGAPERRTDPKYFIPLIHPNTGLPCPVPSSGWSRKPETMQEMIKEGLIVFGEDETTQPQKKVFLPSDSSKQISSVLADGNSGKADLDDLGLEFPYAHPVSLYKRLSLCNSPMLILDFFAGSGTTSHAVIDLNRKDSRRRKFILCEMGEHFENVTKARTEKVLYSENWKKGSPKRNNGYSALIKYLTIETFDDSLSNIQFDDRLAFLPDALKGEYVLKYLFERGIGGSAFNVDKLQHPFSYVMSVATNQESSLKTIDVVETFNYLLGLIVEKSFAKESFAADFVSHETGVIAAQVKEGNEYELKFVTGHLLDGKKVLEIWRDLSEDIVKDNAVLEAVLEKKGIDIEKFDIVYVNGDTTLKNTGGNKVFLIEEEMQKRMFED